MNCSNPSKPCGTRLLASSEMFRAARSILIASEFGCAVESVDRFENLEQIYAGGNIVAVFFEPYGFNLSWHIALKSVLDAAPAALPIVCHRFSDLTDWPAFGRGGGKGKRWK